MPDWTTLIAAVLASSVLSSVVTAIIAPWFNWGIEKKKQTLADRKEKIQKWRQMVTEITRKVEEIQEGQSPSIPRVRSQAGFLIEHHPDFLSLQPLLQRGGILEATIIYSGRTIPSELIHLAAEIDRIEEEWGLR